MDLRVTPVMATIQRRASIPQRQRPRNMMAWMGVAVPAIITKMAAWSIRCMIARAGPPRPSMWYTPLMLRRNTAAATKITSDTMRSVWRSLPGRSRARSPALHQRHAGDQSDHGAEEVGEAADGIKQSRGWRGGRKWSREREGTDGGGGGGRICGRQASGTGVPPGVGSHEEEILLPDCLLPGGRPGPPRFRVMGFRPR